MFVLRLEIMWLLLAISACSESRWFECVRNYNQHWHSKKWPNSSSSIKIGIHLIQWGPLLWQLTLPFCHCLIHFISTNWNCTSIDVVQSSLPSQYFLFKHCYLFFFAYFKLSSFSFWVCLCLSVCVCVSVFCRLVSIWQWHNENIWRRWKNMFFFCFDFLNNYSLTHPHTHSIKWRQIVLNSCLSRCVCLLFLLFYIFYFIHFYWNF